MKKIYTIIAIMLLSAGAFAQTSNNIVIPTESLKVHPATYDRSKLITPNSRRVEGVRHEKSVTSIWIDLDSCDEVNQLAISNLYSDHYIYPLNYDYGTSDSSFKYCIVAFDSLVDVNPANTAGAPFVSYAYSAYPTLYLDSIQLICGQENNSTIDDTLEVQILAVTPLGYPSSTVLKTLVLPIPASQAFGTSWFSGVVLTLNVNLTLPASGKFAVQVNYKDPSKLDTFGIIAGYGYNDPSACGGMGNTQHTTMYGAGNTTEKSNTFLYWSQYGAVLPDSTDAGIYYICSSSDTSFGSFAQNMLIWSYLSTTPDQDSTTFSGIPTYNALGIKLFQNVPNPVNGTSVISYELAKGGNATLNITDIAGRTIKSFSQGVMGAGIHNITIDSKDIAQGVYFYTLNVDGVSLTNKMVINK